MGFESLTLNAIERLLALGQGSANYSDMPSLIITGHNLLLLVASFVYIMCMAALALW